MTKRIREITKQISRCGAKNATFVGVTGKTHLKFDITAPNETHRFFVLSLTPSDHRGDLNKFSDIKRFCRINSSTS